MATLLALLSAVAYGGADFLGGLASRTMPALRVVIASQLFGLVLMLVAAGLLPYDEVTGADLAWGAVAGIAGGTALVVFYRALARGPMSVVTATASVIAAVLPAVFGIATGERPGAYGYAGIGLSIVAIVLVTMDGPMRRLRHAWRSAAFTEALISGIGFGIFFVLLAQTGDGSGLFPLITLRMASLVLLTIVAVLAGRRFSLRAASTGQVVAVGLLDAGANAFVLLALREGLLSLVSVLVAFYPIVTIGLARIVLAERLTAVRMVGVAGAVAGIVLITLG